MAFLQRCLLVATAVMLSASASWSQLQATQIRSFNVGVSGALQYFYAVGKDELRGTYLVGNMRIINNLYVPFLAEFDSSGTHLGDIALPCLPRVSAGIRYITGILHDTASDTILLLFGNNASQDVVRISRSGLCTFVGSFLCNTGSSLIAAPRSGAYWIGMVSGSMIVELQIGISQCWWPIVFQLPAGVTYFGSIAYLPNRSTLLIGNGPVQEIDLLGRSLGVLSFPPHLRRGDVQDFYYSPASNSLITLNGAGLLTELQLSECPGQIEITLEQSCFHGGAGTLSATGCATLGGSVQFIWESSQGFPALFFGVSNSHWAGLRLPQPLSSFGTSVCFLRTGGDVIQPLTRALPPHVFSVPIPSVPTLLGFDTFVQGIGFYFSATNVASSNLVRVRVG